MASVLPLIAAFAAFLSEPSPMPGFYVGDWPLESENDRAWTRVELGFAESLYGDRSANDPEPRFLQTPIFADGIYMCGAYTGRLPGQETDQHLVYIARFLFQNIDTSEPVTPLPVELVNRNATGADLQEYCPNISDDTRQAMLEPS